MAEIRKSAFLAGWGRRFFYAKNNLILVNIYRMT